LNKPSCDARFFVSEEKYRSDRRIRRDRGVFEEHTIICFPIYKILGKRLQSYKEEESDAAVEAKTLTIHHASSILSITTPTPTSSFSFSKARYFLPSKIAAK
jgi:hypothetical protein